MTKESAEKIRDRFIGMYPSIMVRNVESYREDGTQKTVYYLTVNDLVFIDQTYWIIYQGTEAEGNKDAYIQYDMYNDRLYDLTFNSDRRDRYGIEGFLTSDFRHKYYDYVVLNIVKIMFDLMGTDKSQWR